ncbi:hypothetical protein FRC09_010233 [Ceratobasidium sp. 395]|nr:hypothetical protein FRC09_010233 [Ceratobasidium sp. 395]
MVDAATSGEGVIEQKKHMGPNNFEVVLELESSDDENLPDAFAIFSTVGRRASRDEKQQDEVIVVDSDDKDEEVGPVREVEDVKSQKRRVQQERSSEFTSAIQGAFYALAGWQSLEDILPTQKGQDGQPSFWVVDGSEERRVKPAWDLGFDKNWDEWGPAFYKTYRCQVKKNNGLHAKHLLKMSSQTVRRHLAAGLWTICARVAKEKSNGKTETDWQETRPTAE